MKINRTRASLWAAAAVLVVLIAIGCTPAAEPPAQEQAAVQQENAPQPSPAPTEPAPSPPTAIPVDPTAAPAATIEEAEEAEEAEETPLTEPAAEPVVESEPATEVVEAVALFGRTADGALFRGREDAPVTIIDYSDFL